MPPILARVSHRTLEEFLAECGELWNVDGNPTFEEHVFHRPLTTRELIDAMIDYAPDEEYVYIFSDIAPVDEIANLFELGEARTLDVAALEEYQVRSGRGEDFLYVACCEIDASNGTVVTFRPGSITD